MPEGDKAAQHQETTGMEQIAQEKRKRHRMAEQTRIQPVPLESMAADGTLTIHEGVVRRSGFHFRIHEPSVCHATRYLRQGKGLAGKMLRGTGLAIRRRRCDNQNKARLAELEGSERLGLHLRRLLYPNRQIPGGNTLSEKGNQTRGTPQAARPRMVSDGAAADRCRQQAGGIQGIQKRDKAATAIRTGIQCPHSHDGSDGNGKMEANGGQTETNGEKRQQQGISRPGVLCHRQHIHEPEGHRAGYCRI